MDGIRSEDLRQDGEMAPLPPNGIELVAKYVSALAHRMDTTAVFRGHANARWELKPSAFRSETSLGIQNQHQLNKWKKAA